MPLTPFTPITFLSGLSAAWSPINPVGKSAGWSPINPVGNSAGWSPINPVGNSAAWSPINPVGTSAGWSPIGPGGQHGPRSSTPIDPSALSGWEGIDPSWVYAGADSLLGQALRKSRAKVSRLSDAVALDAWTPPQEARNPKAEPLWRWAPEFRVAAVACELLSRVQVHGRSVWLLEPLAAAEPALKAILLLQLPDSLQHVDMQEQLDAVLRAAVEREDRLPEILSQASDFWPFFESVTGVQLAQAPAFAELLRAAQDWVLGLLMLLKHNVAAYRPVQRSSLVMPLIATPGHGSLPSGHATVAAFNAELLRLLMYRDGPDARVQALDRLARRIAFNRVVAGVHFPVDSQAGYALGRQLARTLSALAGNAADSPGELTSDDVLRDRFRLDELAPGELAAYAVKAPAGRQLPAPTPAAALVILWQQAQTELARLRV
jgi:hypothetical protein